MISNEKRTPETQIYSHNAVLIKCVHKRSLIILIKKGTAKY